MPTSVVAAAVYLYEAYQTYAVVAFAVNMVASAIISKAFFSPQGYDPSGASPNLGSRQQVPPATDNKLPVVYGSAFVGGIITDLSISDNNQEMYYVIALSEVTGTTFPDTINFGDVYYGGKKVIFDGTDQYKVTGLLDESTGITDTSVAGKIEMYFYRNGSYQPTNSSRTAINVMQTSGLVYQWDIYKLMSNTAFVIVHLSYNQSANVTGLQQTRFEVINSRYKTGDCIQDYLSNTRYGGAIPATQINQASLDALNTYSDEVFTYTTYDGHSATQARFRFDGVVDTSRTIMANLQDMASCCDCLIKYNEITAQWGVIVQKPSYMVQMDLNDSNMTSAIMITPIDLAGSYNIIEVKFPDKSNQDSFNSATFDLAQIAPSLLFSNEPVNKQSVNLPYVNDDVRAQYIANRMLKSAREDLQLQVNINYVGIQLEAGDIVTVTNSNYGWVAKPFRINKVIEQFEDSGAITAKLTLAEFNSSIYDDISVTQFKPSPNTGIGDPTFFGIVPAPTINNLHPDSAPPSFDVVVTTSSSGITQYAEIWYSAFQYPNGDQMTLLGTTAIQPDGNPYNINTAISGVTITTIPSGNWYFFSRMVNSLAKSSFSPASTLFKWRPTTIQFVDQYVSVAYADDASGTNFSFNPRNKAYFGLCNQTSTTPNTSASAYQWFLASPSFSTNDYLCFINRTGRFFSFGVSSAGYASGSAAFIPTTRYDGSQWSALPDGTNIIDLDIRTGQLIQTGTTTVGTGQIAVQNNPDGTIVAALQPFLNFGTGVYTKTASAATITIDIYGRIVGFETPDDFDYTTQIFTATAGATVFSVTRGAGYITGQCWVLENGVLLNPSEYTDGASSVTFTTGRTAGDIITIISFKSVNTNTSTVYASFTRNSATLTNQADYTASGFTLVSGNEMLFLNGTAVNQDDYNISDQTISFIAGNTTGDLQIIQWANNNLGVPNGTPVNTVTYSVVGQTVYTFSYDPNAFNLYENGVLLVESVDFTTATGSYTLANTPTVSSNLLQQTFARTGAV